MEVLANFFTSENKVKQQQYNTKRKEQLLREDRIDQGLKQAFTQCPNQVFSYVMNMRKLERHISHELLEKQDDEKMYTLRRDFQKHFWPEIHYILSPPEPGTNPLNSVHRWIHEDYRFVSVKNMCNSVLPELNRKLENYNNST